MPTLPTLTATDPQVARITAAYGSVPAYKDWLKAQIKAYVFAVESRAIQTQATADAEAKRVEVDTDLGTMT